MQRSKRGLPLFGNSSIVWGGRRSQYACRLSLCGEHGQSASTARSGAGDLRPMCSYRNGASRRGFTTENSSIPIVFVNVSDPIGSGFIAS